MTISLCPIQQTQWQEQLNGYWLLTLQVQVAAMPVQQEPQQALICAHFSLARPNQQPITLHLFAAQAEQAGQWRLQFLSHDSFRLQPTDQLTITWRSMALPENSDTLLLLGEDVQMAPLFALAKLRIAYAKSSNLALLHATESFPFAIKPARFMVETTPAEAIGACTLLEDWKIANRLCSDSFIGGCAQMSLSDMFEQWLQAMQYTDHQDTNNTTRWKVVISASRATADQCISIINTVQRAGLNVELEAIRLD